MKIQRRVVAADFRTGRRLIDVPFTGGSFENTLNEAGSLSVNVPLYDQDVRALALNLTGAPAHTLLGCLYNDVFVQGGPVWEHKFDQDKGVLTMTAAGGRSFFVRRPILPPNDKNINPLTSKGAANPAFNTTLSNLDLGSIARAITKQANDDGGMPMTFEDPRAGTNTRTYLGADFKSVGDALNDLNGVINGPDMAFDMGWTADRLGVQINMRTGTEAQPRLFSRQPIRWDYTSRNRGIRNLQVTTDGSEMGSVVWTTGGRVNDVLMIDREDDGGKLAGRGYPRMDIVDSSHSSVSVASTLQDYGRETLRLSSDITSFWEFEVRIDQAPYFGTYGVGDYCVIAMKRSPYLPDGEYLRRIVRIAGELNSPWVKITTGEVIGGNPNG